MKHYFRYLWTKIWVNFRV